MSIKIKKDKDLKVYTAIYKQMLLAGQGKTREEALLSLLEAIEGYIEYIVEEHPNECVKKYFNRGKQKRK